MKLIAEKSTTSRSPYLIIKKITPTPWSEFLDYLTRVVAERNSVENGSLAMIILTLTWGDIKEEDYQR